MIGELGSGNAYAGRGMPSVIFLDSVVRLAGESTAVCSCRLICPGIQMNVTCAEKEVNTLGKWVCGGGV